MRNLSSELKKQSEMEDETRKIKTDLKSEDSKKGVDRNLKVMKNGINKH